MLQSLQIRNYAIIDEIVINFGSNYNVITGETGAGKSILMGALALILGQRATASMLKDPDQKCLVEAVFKPAPSDEIDSFFSINDIDYAGEIIIRRELSAAGTKSRSFINDTPASLTQLKDLAALLVDLHQQFDNIELTGKNFQLLIIDAVADNKLLLKKMKEQYLQLQAVSEEIEGLSLKQSAFQKEQDYKQFLYDELNDAAFKENELEQLDDELKLLSNAEMVKGELAGLSFSLSESETPIVQTIKQLQQKLSSLQNYLPTAGDLATRLSSVHIELSDIAGEIEGLSEKIVFDNERINEVNDRIGLGHKLLKKHNASGTAQLLQIQAELEQQLFMLLNLDSEIAALKGQKELLLKEANQTAAGISANRQKQAKPFAEKANKLLHSIGMPNAIVKIDIQPASLTQSGSDNVAILFDANKSGRFESLAKVASGGELSRISLALKSLVAEKLSLPTLIFDEIDTGISGEAAKQVGIIMKKLAGRHQIIVVSHQPQVAAKADTHLYVYKAPGPKGIITHIKVLQENERVEAIAKMIAGETPTEAALANARELVG